MLAVQYLKFHTPFHSSIGRFTLKHYTNVCLCVQKPLGPDKFASEPLRYLLDQWASREELIIQIVSIGKFGNILYAFDVHPHQSFLHHISVHELFLREVEKMCDAADQILSKWNTICRYRPTENTPYRRCTIGHKCNVWLKFVQWNCVLSSKFVVNGC